MRSHPSVSRASTRDSEPFIHSLSGSQTMFPSSSYDANRFMNDEAATTSAVETSYTMLVYGRERGIERAGRWASKSTPGIHSTRLGPWPHARHEVSISVSEPEHFLAGTCTCNCARTSSE